MTAVLERPQTAPVPSAESATMSFIDSALAACEDLTRQMEAEWQAVFFHDRPGETKEQFLALCHRTAARAKAAEQLIEGYARLCQSDNSAERWASGEGAQFIPLWAKAHGVLLKAEGTIEGQEGRWQPRDPERFRQAMEAARSGAVKYIPAEEWLRHLNERRVAADS